MQRLTSTARQIWTRETLEVTFAAERAKLPEPLRDVVPEIILVDNRDRVLETPWAEIYGVKPDVELNRVTASTDPVLGRIVIYQNGDLRDEPDWQGALVDLREELGHSLAVHLFNSPEPPVEWRQVMASEDLLSAAPGDDFPREDWALAIALWLADEAEFIAAYPQRASFLRRFGFGTIKTV
ncbi:MAG TPA: hypothetical protein G4N98_09045 [Thermoflexia bacterium]|nr:hypothetical protein [Thermoflexia bacterium]